MSSDPRSDRAEGGFTLIEVLVAMVILAIGLLGLEALGISAARANANAERQTRYAFLAGEYLESALSALRNGQTQVALPGGGTAAMSLCDDVSSAGVRVSREVVASAVNPDLYHVTVEVLPAGSGTTPLYSVEASALTSTPLAAFGANGC